jgi:excisionase family DNA binding protein
VAKRPNADERPAWVTEAVAELPAIARIEEVAGVIRMCPRTIRRLIASGQLTAIRGRESGAARVLIPRAEVARYLASLDGGAS